MACVCVLGCGCVWGGGGGRGGGGGGRGGGGVAGGDVQFRTIQLSFKSAVELVQVVGQVKVVNSGGGSGLVVGNLPVPSPDRSRVVSRELVFSLFEYSHLASLTTLLNAVLRLFESVFYPYSYAHVCLGHMSVVTKLTTGASSG